MCGLKKITLHQKKYLNVLKNSIEKDYKSIEILSHVETRKDETEYIRHRLVLKYDNGCISAEVIDMIVKDFYPNYNKDKWLN